MKLTIYGDVREGNVNVGWIVFSVVGEHQVTAELNVIVSGCCCEVVTIPKKKMHNHA